jgi:hypothetical protein
MRVPVTALGFGLFIAGSVIFSQLRGSYLRRASKTLFIEASRKIVLRYAMWVYTLPLLAFAEGVLLGRAALNGSIHPEAVLIYKATCAFCFLCGSFLCYRFGTGRVTIFNGKLTYTEGSDRREVHADDIFGFSFNGISFLVKKKSERLAKIPATFQHSEIILAFLKQSAVNKE